MKTGSTPQTYKFLTEEQLISLNTERLVNVLRTAYALYISYMTKRDWQGDSLSHNYEDYRRTIKKILLTREHLPEVKLM